MFSYGRSYMPHCEEVLVREAVYGPLRARWFPMAAAEDFTEGLPAGGNGFAANQLKPSLPDNEASSKPSDDKETPVSPDRKPDLSLDSLLTENTVPTSSPDPKTLRLPASLKAEAVPEPSSAMLGMFGIACLLMRRKRELNSGPVLHSGFPAGKEWLFFSTPEHGLQTGRVMKGVPA